MQSALDAGVVKEVMAPGDRPCVLYSNPFMQSRTAAPTEAGTCALRIESSETGKPVACGSHRHRDGQGGSYRALSSIHRR